MYEMNPWWESGQIPKDFLPAQKRELFHELEHALERRFIELIVGLRRTGKTTLMFQLMNELLRRGVGPRSILYFSFDERSIDLKSLIREYEEKVLRERLREARVFIFLDEIHKLPEWSEKLKLLYDMNPRVKLIVSGSASLNLMHGARESLAGRCVFHRLDPLSFLEYLKLRGERVPAEAEFEVHERRLAISFQQFLRRGFPEIIGANDREAEQYVRELVLERVVYRDIPESFRADDLELLRLLVELICSKPGITLNVDSISRDLGRARRTIRNYLEYLEQTFVIRRVSNLRGSMLAASRKNRRGYPYHPCLSTTADEGELAEATVASEINAQHYWRLRNHEVDFVLRDGDPLPVEVKYGRRVDRRELKGPLAFCKRFGVGRGVVVTRDESGRLDGLELVPMLRFVLFKERFLEKKRAVS